jgi:hypothetical protein
MNPSFFSLIQSFWIAYQLAMAVLCVWIAITVFRQRSTATWMTLIGAILLSIFMLGSRIISAFFYDSGSGTAALFQALSIGYSVAMLTFLIGLLLHLQRRNLESDRIADLEAILQDRQQNSDPR